MKKLLLILALMTGSAASAQIVDQQLAGTKADKACHYNADLKADKGSAFIVISKKDTRLYVYATANGDTSLLAKYPACLSKCKGQKERPGDMKTPSSPKGKPFSITQIQDASTWKHDFKDGRGNIKAYGNWFMRLKTPGHSGIGIHGSTNNAESVPGRASEGCIRLRDNDIIDLKERYAYVGMPVIILDEETSSLPFENRVHGKAVPSAPGTPVAHAAAQAETAKAVKKDTKPAIKTEPTKAATAKGNTKHTVKKGESLGAIAKKYNVTVAQLKKANNIKGDAINAGQTIIIPATSKK